MMNTPEIMVEQATNITYRKIDKDYYEPIMCGQKHNVVKHVSERRMYEYKPSKNDWVLDEDQVFTEQSIYDCYICNQKLSLKTFYGFKFNMGKNKV